MPRRRFIVIPATCCNGNCDKPAASAQAMLNGWGSLCEDCQKVGKFLLNGKSMDKIIAAIEQSKIISRGTKKPRVK